MTTSHNKRREGFRSGLAAIVGAPNAGKSTLLNRILGEKISITSRRPQTTRNRILGVAHRPGSQIVFLDTPGIHRARGELNSRIVDVAIGTLQDADLVLMLLDAAAPDVESEALLLQRVAARRTPVILALNKIDLVEKPLLLHMIDQWRQRHCFVDIVPISALASIQLDVLLELIEAQLPEGPPFFPEDVVTDLPVRFIVAELVREKVFRLTGQEIPYASAVTVESYVEDPGASLVRIHATIHVERDSQKAIIIGRSGEKLKQIGTQARRDVERLLGSRVFLKLFVRVEKNWTRDTRALRRLGY